MSVLFNFEIHTPYRPFFIGRVESIILTLADGEAGIYAKHSSFTAPVVSCILRIKDEEGVMRSAFITDGILEVKDHKTVLMVDAAEWPNEIDQERARAAKQKAEENMKTASLKFEVDNAKAQLRRAEFRLKACTLLLLCGFFLSFCKAAPPAHEAAPPEKETTHVFRMPEGGELPVSAFGEIWAYVIAGREAALRSDLPISDIGYFGADIDSYGSLVDVPDRRKLPSFSGRVHLVVKCDSRSLTHFVLVPGSAERKALIADLAAASSRYDGLQIDFENVPQRDGGFFFSFLAELRTACKNKIFTVALPARMRKLKDDVYDYEKILPLVDRILVMAYDEHWSTSAPGPVASLSWCKKVAEYSLNVIGREKLIMGLPFYGRAWGNPNPSQAHVYTGIERVINENQVTDIRRENGIPTFEYKIPVSVKVYYDDEYSLSARMEMYRTMGVPAIGFWRLGQETPAVWSYIKLNSR